MRRGEQQWWRMFLARFLLHPLSHDLLYFHLSQVWEKWENSIEFIILAIHSFTPLSKWNEYDIAYKLGKRQRKIKVVWNNSTHLKSDTQRIRYWSICYFVLTEGWKGHNLHVLSILRSNSFRMHKRLLLMIQRKERKIGSCVA